MLSRRKLMINLLAAAIGTTWELPFEIPFIVWLQSLGGEGSFLYYLMNFITMFGEEMILVGVMGFVYWGLDKKRGEKIGMFMLTAALVNPMIKNIACRTRPFDSHPDLVDNLRDVDGYSFPSGHSSGSASVFVGTAVAYKDKKSKWLISLAVIIPLLVALSRNYLGAHYLTDVVAGLALGVAVVFLVDWLTRVVKNKYFIYGGILIVGLAGFFYCTTSDFFTAYGIAVGFTFGMLFEEKVTKFQNTKVWWRIVLRVAVGGGLYLGLNSMFKAIVGAIYPDYEGDFWFESIFRVLRYAVIVFLLLGVYPLLFAQTEKLWKKLGWTKKEHTVEENVDTADIEPSPETDNTAEEQTQQQPEQPSQTASETPEEKEEATPDTKNI